MSAKTAIGIIGTVAALAASFFVSEKSVSRDASHDRVTVVYWEKWTGDEAKEMRKVVDAFNRSQDRIFVQYLSISGVDQKTMLATAGGNPPDIAGIWQDQVAQFADAKALTDLTELAAKSGLTEKTYIQGYWDALFYNNKLWALPSTPASVALHVRQDLVPPDVATPETFPKTFEALDKLNERITRRSKDGTIEMAGFIPCNPGWWNYGWGKLFGGDIVEGNNITVNSKENLRAFTWLQSYAKLFGSTTMQSFQGGFGNFSSPQDPFMVGKVAAEINGVWKANYIRVYKPDTKWFAVPIPYPEDRPDLANHAMLSQDILAIPRGAKHVNEAFEFIRFVQRQDVMEGLCKGHGKNSPLRIVSEDFLNTHQNKYIRLFDQLARSPKAFANPKIGVYKQINDEMNVAVQEVNSGSKEPKQALDDAQARLEKVWKIYQEQVLNP